MKANYDIVVIGSGLGGLTAANRLARSGHNVLLAEQHSQLGGVAAFFKRKSHVFDVSLHGFPIAMKKSLRKYWGKEFADRIIQVKRIRFDNPQFKLETTFDKEDFCRHLCETFGLSTESVASFFDTLAGMNYYDDRSQTTAELFEEFFPGRSDVWRLLMEPITYANGSTLQEPAISYGIVFGNFMNKGVYTFQGGTDTLIRMMTDQLRERGVDIATNARVERIMTDRGKVSAVLVNGREIATRAVVSNANLPGTVFGLLGEDRVPAEYAAGLKTVRLSNSSAQVYMGVTPGATIPHIGDLLFVSSHPEFDAGAICSMDVTSRTYSIYYPEIRPGSQQYTIVASMNANYQDWSDLADAEYRAAKKNLIENSLDALEPFLPGIRAKIDYVEAATPRTFERYTLHRQGASFGSKFEGLQYSMQLHEQVPGLFHTGSTGIIMSGWLGSANYGVITANEVDKYMEERR